MFAFISGVGAVFAVVCIPASIAGIVLAIRFFRAK